METFLRRNFKVKGNIACIYKPVNTALIRRVENIEVQLWHKKPMVKVFLGSGLTDSSGDFIVEFEADSPIDYIVDGKISDVFLEAYYNGERLKETVFDILKGLVAYWKLDETSGTTASDATGNGHSGTLGGTVPADWATGKINNGLEVFGSSDGSVSSYMEVSGSMDFNFGTKDFTYSLWVLANNTSYYYSVIDTGYSGTDSLLVEFSMANTIKVFVNGSPIYEKPFVGDIANWNHVAFRRIEGEIDVLINGVSLGKETFTGNVGCPSNLVFGKFFGGGETLDGKLDEIGVWNGHGLNDDEISVLYNSGNGLQYPF